MIDMGGPLAAVYLRHTCRYGAQGFLDLTADVFHRKIAARGRKHGECAHYRAASNPLTTNAKRASHPRPPALNTGNITPH